ncbi:MAG: acetyl-CoA hydrolase/transferase family protein [Candidatus Cryosericum sp.]
MEQRSWMNKVVSMDEALGRISSGDTVVVGMAAAQPQGFLSSLHSIRDRVHNVKVVSCLLLKKYPFLVDVRADADTPFRMESWYFGDSERELYKKGLVSFIPNNLHNAGREKIQAEPINVFVGTATPPDSHGFMSLSLCLVYEKDMIENADLVILEINENLPRTFGDTQVHVDDVDLLVQNNAPLLTIPVVEASEVEQHIGENIAQLIADGATLQIGIGGIPNAIMRFLSDKKHLGIHTEMITDGIVDLVKAGVIDNTRKTLHKGKIIGAFAMGTEPLYEFINENVGVDILRGSYVNDPYVVAQNECMVSINTSLQVDLAGQVCSESIGYRHYTGTGGQLDMHRGATLSRGGKGIIALRSSVKDDEISTIVPMLSPGSSVSIPRQDTDYIVTEFGAAHLKGKSVHERALALIAIAHPKFRETLAFEAKKIGVL